MDDPGPVVSVGDNGGEGYVYEGGFEFFWYSPLALMAQLIGTADPTFQYWCAMCGTNNTQPALVNVQSIVADGPYTYSCFTAGSVSAIGLCGLMQQWMFQSLWVYLGGGDEGECTPF